MARNGIEDSAEAEVPAKTDSGLNIRGHHFNKTEAKSEVESSYQDIKPKTWSLEDPFQHAPEKPKEDQWAIILKPLMDKDGAQCKAWKEEVENLLIFAGLFSAVVTAFVIESYKSLQPDPNNMIVGLLLHIANRLDGPLHINGTSPPPIFPTPVSIVASFPQPSPSIRINIFWFLSLILSLTTVLVGTISLQWLREHQSYPDLSPKQRLAVLRMRSEAMEMWYVPHIFSALPLLLQGALVLFFAGMVDFSLLLGCKIAIPVCVIIGATLLFLLATTAVPTLEGFAMYFPLLFPRKTVPAPCPYKSPQSQALRGFSKPLFRLFHPLIPGLYSICDAIYRRFTDKAPLEKHHGIPYISDIWCQETWPQFDLRWLYMRDACQQRIFDNGPNLYEHRTELWADLEDFPLSDVTRCLRDAVRGVPGSKHAESFLWAAFHCLEEVSDPIFQENIFSPNSHHCPDRRNRYFYKLLEIERNNRPEDRYHYLSDLLVRDENVEQFPDQDGEIKDYYGVEHAALFHHEHRYIFYDMIIQKHQAPALYAHKQELVMRMMCYLFGRFMETAESPFGSTLPSLFDWGVNEYWYTNSGVNSATIVDVLMTLFTFVAADNLQKEDLMDSLHSHPFIPKILSDAAYSSLYWFSDFERLFPNGEPDNEYIGYVSEQYISLFNMIAKRLEQQRSNTTPNAKHIPSPLFYLSSLFIRPLSRHWSRLPESSLGVCSALEALLVEMKEYKEWTSGSVDSELEQRLGCYDGIVSKVEFSEKWWAFLDPQMLRTSLSTDSGGDSGDSENSESGSESEAGSSPVSSAPPEDDTKILNKISAVITCPQSPTIDAVHLPFNLQAHEPV